MPEYAAWHLVGVAVGWVFGLITPRPPWRWPWRRERIRKAYRAPIVSRWYRFEVRVSGSSKRALLFVWAVCDWAYSVNWTSLNHWTFRRYLTLIEAANDRAEGVRP